MVLFDDCQENVNRRQDSGADCEDPLDWLLVLKVGQEREPKWRTTSFPWGPDA